MLRRAIAVTAVLVVVLSPVTVLGATKAGRPAPAAADWRTPDPQNILVIDTSKGRVIVELIPEVAPGHVERLRVLTRRGFYDGRTFFRVIDRFMAQTGDPGDTGEGASDLPNLKAEFTWRRGADSGFVTAARPTGADLGFVASMPAVSQAWSYATMTADHKVSAWGSYCPGVLGAARDDDNDSANSQFFLMRQAYPSLDKRYTAFGRVISGLEAVRAIKTGEPVPKPQDLMQKVRLLADIPEAQRPKVRIIDPKSAWFQAEIQQVRKAEGADFSLCDVTVPVEVK